MTTTRIVIVGGGVIGLCSAYYALKRGFAVTVVERGEAGGDCCSLGNAGLVVPSHFIPLAAPGIVAKGLRIMLDPESPFFIRPRLDLGLLQWGWRFFRSANARNVAASRELLRDLHLESRRLFIELAAEDDFGLVQRGMLCLCKSQHGLDEESEVAAKATEIGLKTEVLDASATAAREPNLTMDVVGSVYYAQDCHLNPMRFVAAMHQRVLAMGGVIEHGVSIDTIHATRGTVNAVAGAGRRFEGDRFVIATGSWSAQLLETVGVRLLLQAGKGYSLTLPAPPELPQHCAVLAEAKVAVTPMGTSLRFAGTMEVAGLDHSINAQRVRGIMKGVEAFLPRFSSRDFADVAPWAGLRPVSADGVPYLGSVSALPNMIVATGHSMMGVSLAPVSGRLVADLLSGDRPFRPIDAMAPGRF
ncbi:MAG: FAD-dependent oxidoreductase [Gemmatimonadaceae bacterium]